MFLGCADGYRALISDLGDWHVVVLNSRCDAVGCTPGSAQARWLREDLAAHPAACTLAYFHRARFSSGAEHGSALNLQPLWEVMYAAGVDVVLSAHEHLYERFAPQTPDGKADPVRGIRQFTVGTGGRSRYDIAEVQPNSEVIDNATFGVLKLTLGAGRYHWEFLPVAPASFRDSGIGYCH